MIHIRAIPHHIILSFRPINYHRLYVLDTLQNLPEFYTDYHYRFVISDLWSTADPVCFIS